MSDEELAELARLLKLAWDGWALNGESGSSLLREALGKVMVSTRNALTWRQQDAQWKQEHG
jgi:hypothetical protein